MSARRVRRDRNLVSTAHGCRGEAAGRRGLYQVFLLVRLLEEESCSQEEGEEGGGGNVVKVRQPKMEREFRCVLLSLSC